MTMPAKANKKQTLAVLLLSVLLITLCTGGLWFYVKNADAETGVQEAAATELPKEDEYNITFEKYDNFPVPDRDMLESSHVGCGLTKSEKERLPELQKAYAEGRRPQFPAHSIPDAYGIAIVPLDPNAFGGMTEYYIFPGPLLTDEMLLQLIDYHSQKGAVFSPELLTNKNCMRGFYNISSRYLSAGETERQKILSKRVHMEGLLPGSPELTADRLPLSGIGGVYLNKNDFGNSHTFFLLPLRELTDDELLQWFFDESAEGFTYLKPAEETDLDPAKDTQRIRAFLEEFMGMPKAAENYMMSYKQKNRTGEIRLEANFYSATINGRRTNYYFITDIKGSRYIYIDQTTMDFTMEQDQAIDSNADTSSRKSVDELTGTAKAAVEKLTGMKAVSTDTLGISTSSSDDKLLVLEPTWLIHVRTEEEGFYAVHLRVSDGTVYSIRYQPSDDPDDISQEYHW